MRENKPWNDECLVGVYSEDLSDIASAIERAEALIDDRVVDAEVAVLIRKVNFCASQIICYAQEIVETEPLDAGNENDELKDDDGFGFREGTHSIGDLWGACHCVFEALELSEDRIVPPEIVALLQETRDCLDRMLFYKPKAEEHEVDIDDGEPPF